MGWPTPLWSATKSQGGLAHPTHPVALPMEREREEGKGVQRQKALENVATCKNESSIKVKDKLNVPRSFFASSSNSIG
jgi:hypothetical protein